MRVNVTNVGTHRVSIKKDSSIKVNSNIGSRVFVASKPDTTVKVTTARGSLTVPTRFRDLNDFDATNLQGNNIVIFDAVAQKFRTLPVDDILRISAQDGDLPDVFVEQISDEVDLDGGKF